MQYNLANSNQVNFGTLYTGFTVSQKLIKEGPKSDFAKEVNSVKKMIRKEGLNKKENVDILLHYDTYVSKEGFYGVISHKKQGIPINPGYRHPISKDKKAFEGFCDWVNSWEQVYSNKKK